MKTQEILQQIDQVLDEWKTARAASKHDDLSDRPEYITAELITRLYSTIDRLAPNGTHHKSNLDFLSKKYGVSTFVIQYLVGALKALRKDFELGYLRSLVELVHADTFSEFLEMAEHLHSSGYKDAAAVIAGSVLEQHLKSLCIKNAIPVEVNGKPKKAETMNTDLASASVCTKLDQKNITSWLGLRNDAAHGNYGAYTEAQANLMIASVRDFLTRHPA